MARKGKRKRETADLNGSNSVFDGVKTGNKYKRPVGPYMNYYIHHCRTRGPNQKITNEVKRNLRAEFESLSEAEKNPFIEDTKRQKEEYKKMKMRMMEDADNQTLTLNTRCSPMQLAKVISYLRESKKDNVLGELGLGTLVHLKPRRLRRDLCRYLVENFDVRGRCIQFEGHKIPITVKDVAALIGIKNEGDDVDELVKGTNWSEVIEKYGIEKNVKFSQLEERIRTVEADSAELKAYILLYVVGVFLCPMSSVSPSEKYFNCLCEKGMNGELNWAQHVYDCLIRGIETYLESDREGGYLNGCVLLLEVRLYDFWNRVNTGDFDFTVRGPRIKAWDTTSVDALLEGNEELRGPWTYKGIGRKGKQSDRVNGSTLPSIPNAGIQTDGNWDEWKDWVSKILIKLTGEMAEVKSILKTMSQQDNKFESRMRQLDSSTKKDQGNVKIGETGVVATEKSKAKVADGVVNEDAPVSTDLNPPSQRSVKNSEVDDNAGCSQMDQSGQVSPRFRVSMSVCIS